MAKGKPFYFKHFIIHQDKCAMKVGADSMLLGALTKVKDSQNILDIGAGTGILTLMLAQRSTAQIYAVEPDEAAYMQATENALNSCWKKRIEIYHSSIQEFEPRNGVKYDIIISNPPYFPQTNSNKSKSPEKTRAIARDQSSLSYIDLVKNTSRLLQENGKFYVIIPYTEKDNFIVLAKEENLFLQEIIAVKSRSSTPFIRAILCLSKTRNTAPVEREFTIYEQGNLYTEEYLEATKDYHAHDMRKRKEKTYCAK